MSYTCSKCNYHWNKYDKSKRHNCRNCPNNLSEKKCAICLEKDDICVKLNCNHTFHQDCIKNWVNNFYNKVAKPTCPICRATISEYYVKKIGAKRKLKTYNIPDGWERKKDLNLKVYYFHTKSEVMSYIYPTKKNQLKLIHLLPIIFDLNDKINKMKRNSMYRNKVKLLIKKRLKLSILLLS